MKFLPLVWRNLLRRKVRTIFTVLSIFTAFVLFGVLMALRAAFSMGIELAGADRLMILNKISIIMPLPESYGERVRRFEVGHEPLQPPVPRVRLDRRWRRVSRRFRRRQAARGRRTGCRSGWPA